MQRRNIIPLTLFAIAMAHVEAALVVDLRGVYYPTDLRTIFPLALLSPRDLVIEVTRELATVVMLASVSLLAAARPLRVFAVFLYLFGLWDLFYYVWLKLMIGWPVHWLEWDVLYLIPWPWLGPWLAAALVAALFVAWGAWTLWSGAGAWFAREGAVAFGLGAVLVLATFLWAGSALLGGGEETFRAFVPGRFPWALFAVGYLLLAVGLGWLGRSAGSAAVKQ